MISYEPNSENKYLFTVFFNDDPIQNIHISIFGSRPKIKSLEHLKELEYLGARRFAIKRLSMQAMLSTVLHEKLIERKVSPSIADQVVNECIEAGYINDQDWVESFVRVQKRKRAGPQAIRMKLLQKRVSSDLIDSCLDVDEERQIKELLETKYRTRNLDDPKEKQKVIASLQRKGYSLQAVFSLIN